MVKLILPVEYLGFFPHNFQFNHSSTYKQVLVTNSNTKKDAGVLERTIFFKNPEKKKNIFRVNFQYTSPAFSGILSAIGRFLIHR